MLQPLRRSLDAWLTGLTLLVVLVLTLLYPPDFASRGGLLLARSVFWSIGVLLVLLFVAARFHSVPRRLLHGILLFFPMAVAVISYAGLRLFHAEAITTWFGISARDSWMMAADNALFGKTPFLWLSHWGLESHLLQRSMTVFYGLYPLMPFLILAWFLFQRDMARFYLLRRTLILSLYLGYCCYILVPVRGPLSLLNQPPLFIDSSSTYAFLMGNFRYVYDCFPSLHMANPWLMAWLCRGKVPRGVMILLVIACCGITLSTLVLRLHYGIDLLAGLVWAALMVPLGRASLPEEVLTPADPLREKGPAYSAV